MGECVGQMGECPILMVPPAVVKPRDLGGGPDDAGRAFRRHRSRAAARTGPRTGPRSRPVVRPSANVERVDAAGCWSGDEGAMTGVGLRN